MDEQKNNLGDRALKSLQKEFIVVGKTSIKGWHDWLVLGIIAGITAGVLLVANRSGEFDFGFAAFKPAIKAIRLISPNGGEVLEAGKQYKISWESTPAPKNSWVANNSWVSDIQLRRVPGDAVTSGIVPLHHPDNTPFQWPTTGSIEWKVPDKNFWGVNRGLVDEFKIRVHLYAGRIDKIGQVRLIDSDESDAPFKIVVPPSITVTYPNGGEVWKIGTEERIKWVSTGQYRSRDKITELYKGDELVETIATVKGGRDNPEEVTGVVVKSSYPLGNDYRIKISPKGSNEFDFSDTPFGVTSFSLP